MWGCQPPRCCAVRMSASTGVHGSMAPSFRRWLGPTHHNCISGKQLVDALMGQSALGLRDRSAAVAMAQQLLQHKLISVVSDSLPSTAEMRVQDSDDRHYRLLADAPRKLRYGQALNTHIWWSGEARDAVTVGCTFQTQTLETWPLMYSVHMEWRKILFLLLSCSLGCWVQQALLIHLP